MTMDPLSALVDAGVSIWLDDLSRERLRSGSLADLIEAQHVTGVTTNTTIRYGISQPAGFTWPRRFAR